MIEKNVTNYPFVFVHGFMGYGDLAGASKFVPTWGLISGDILPALRADGFTVVNPSIGPFSSAWDRACELYAQLVGGTVDYGAAHSKKYKHKRFGNTYEALLPNWGKTDDKINLMGHSFGGETVRILVQLLADGCDEEKAATKKGELSPLFEGGKGNLVHSVTTLFSPHNGVTWAYNYPDALLTAAKAAICGAGHLLGKTKIKDMYDFNLDHHTPLSFARSGDDGIYDLTLKGAKEINSHLSCQPNIYYFSFAADKTRAALFSKKYKRVPEFSMSPTFKGASKQMGNIDFSNPKFAGLDERWLPNDGQVNTFSALAPFDEPQVEFYRVQGDIKPGIWHIMEILNVDHNEGVGLAIPRKSYRKLCDAFEKQMYLINSLK